MAKDPGIGYRITATITAVRGECGAGHRQGDSFEMSCHDPGGLCGFFYHDIFPALQTFQFGGSMPWWRGDAVELECPDRRNAVTLRLERAKRPG